MSEQTLYVQVEYPTESIFTYLLMFILLIGVVGLVFASGSIKNTYPYYAKETLKGTITCEEFKKFYKELRKIREREIKNDKDLIVKSVKKLHDFLEYMNNKEQDEKVAELDGPTGRIEEYYKTYNVPENHFEMTVEEVLQVMCLPEEQQQ